MRTFLALPCPSSFRPTLRELQEALSRRSDLRKVDPENFHMTVKFLGDTSQNKLDTLDETFQSRLPTPGPLRIRLENVGVFPSLESPSVGWVGIRSTQALRKLQQCVEELTVDQGFDPRDHEFRPHITLGRFNHGRRDKESILKWIKQHGEDDYGNYEVPDLHLLGSKLTSNGPIYRTLAKWPL